MARALPALAVLAALLAAPQTAAAAPACSFDSGAATVTVSGHPRFTLARAGDLIEVRAYTTLVPCGSPTVTTVDNISVSTTPGASSGVVIDLSGGPFAPGKTPEGSGPLRSSEIEFGLTISGGYLTVLGGDASESVVVGAGSFASGANLNAGERVGLDNDVTFTGAESVALRGNGGGDRLSAAGGGGAPPDPFAGTAFITGDEGNDRLDGGDAADSIDVIGPQPGDDTISGGGGNDSIGAGPGSNSYDGGAGTDTLHMHSNTPVTVDLAIAAPQQTGHGLDTIASIENAWGGSAGDVLKGDDGPNTLLGFLGDDVIVPRGGDDLVDGGEDKPESFSPLPMPAVFGGFDTVDYSEAPAGVTVDLALTAPQDTGGSGMDRMLWIDNVTGSAHADDLAGTGVPNQFTNGANTLDGRAGADLLRGRGGPDAFLARDGAGDFVLCGDGDDSVIADDAGVDTLSDCESVAFADTRPPATAIDSGPSGVVRNSSATFTFSSDEHGSTFECSLDGAPFGPCTSPLQLGGLTDGEHELRVRATDAFGNTDPTPASAGFTVDTRRDGGAGGGGGDGAGDPGGPRLTRLALSNRSFRVGRRPTALSAAQRRRAPVGTTFRYRLSEAATLRVTIERVRGERRRVAGTLVRGARQGGNRLAFSGRLGSRPLAAGRYRARFAAVDPDGNRSNRASVRFRVVRR